MAYVTSEQSKIKNYKGETMPAVVAVEGEISAPVTTGTTSTGKEWARTTLKMADKKAASICRYAGLAEEKKDDSDTFSLISSNERIVAVMKTLTEGQKVVCGGTVSLKNDLAGISLEGIIPHPAKGQDMSKEFYSMEETWGTGSRKMLCLQGVVTRGKVYGKEGPVYDQDSDGNPRVCFSMRTANTMSYINKVVNGAEMTDDKSNFITVSITGPNAEKLKDYLKPGKIVNVLGAFYVKQNGKYTNYTLYVNNTTKGHYGFVILLGDAPKKETIEEAAPKAAETTPAAEAPAKKTAAKKAAKKAEPVEEPAEESFNIDELFAGDDDIPF